MKKQFILGLFMSLSMALQAQVTDCEIAYKQQLVEAGRLLGLDLDNQAILAYYKAKYMAEQCHLPTDLSHKGINDAQNRKDCQRIWAKLDTYSEQIAKAYNYELLKDKFDYYTAVDIEIGFVRAIKDGQYYLVDKAGKAYKAAFRVEDLNSETTALCLSGSNLNIPPNLAKYKGLKVLILNQTGYKDNLQLSEEDFKAICQLTQLEVLIVRDCKVESVPQEIGQLTKLVRLDLRGNNISNLSSNITQLSRLKVLSMSIYALPNDDLEYIGQLTSLVDLDLGACYEQSLPESFRQLSQLNRFNIYSNASIKLPTFIREWKHLKVLSFRVYRGGQAIPDFIGDMDSLVSLSVKGYPILNVPNALTKLHNLKELSLIDDAACAFPQIINRLTSLTNLEVQVFTLDSIPDSISNLSNLKQLQLICNSYLELRTLPESVCSLTNLTYLGVQRASALPSSIEKLKNLEVLQLAGSGLETLPESIGHLSKLRHINLAYNGCRDLPESIGQLSNLTHLYLQRNHLRTLPASIGKLSHLRCLNLETNWINELPETIGGMTELRYWDLSVNELLQLPDALGNLKSLTDLNLRRNYLVILPASITELSSLHNLNLKHNKLRYLPDYLPANLSRLYSLETLAIDAPFLVPINVFANMPALNTLELSYAKELSEPQKQDIIQLYPQCKVVFD